MCKILVKTNDLTYEEWLRYRKQGIGGSDAGAICGLNPYVSPIAVYMDKTEDVINNIDNEVMKQGRDLENYVAQRFMEATGLKVRRSNFIYVHKEYPFMLANIDRMIVGENIGLECKTASPYSINKWKDGEIPSHYLIQCYHYMAVTGAEAWYIAVVIFGNEFKYIKIERDEEIIENLIKIEKDFWNNHVLPRIIPEPDGSESADKLISKYFNQVISDSKIQLQGFDDKLERREELTELINKLDIEKKKIEQELKLHMKEAEVAISNKYKVSWKNTIASRLDSSRLKTEMPDIYKKYSNPSSYRRLIISTV